MKILFEPTDRANWGKKMYRQYLLNLGLSRLAYPVSVKLEVSVRYVVKLSERSLLLRLMKQWALTGYYVDLI